MISSIHIATLSDLSAPLPPQRTGLLSMLDVECGLRGTAETYLQKVRAAHRSSGRLRDPPPGGTGTFAVQHYAGLVVYSAADFLGEDRGMRMVDGRFGSDNSGGSGRTVN